MNYYVTALTSHSRPCADSGIFAVIAIAFYIFLSPKMEKRSNRMTQTFTENLNAKQE